MNMIDRAIRAVSPVWGVKRAAARRALTVIDRADQRVSQRFVGKPADWDRNTGNPDDARLGRVVDRRRVLELVAQDPFARKALAALVNNTVGWGITGAPKKAPATFRNLWNDWLKICDWNGRLNFYGLQELAVRTMFREGECFIVLQQLSLQDAAGTVPLRLQLLDAGMLATGLTSFQGNSVVHGVEYDARGRPVAYHFYQGRPNQLWVSYQTVRILAADVIHLFVQEYVGQRHGVSVFNTVVKRLGDIDEGVEAELVRKNIEACFAAFITQGVDDEGRLFGALDADAPTPVEGLQAETLTPGMINRLAPGEGVRFGDPKASGGLAEILRLALLSSAAGTGITYEHFGDLSNVNFSSYKAGNLEFQRSTGRIQFNTIIPVFLDRVAARFQEAAFTAGMMANRTYEMNWAPPPFESIDRMGDVQADILEMAAGVESRQNLVVARGHDPDQLRADIATDRAANKLAGLVFAGDFPPTQYAAAKDPAAATAAPAN
ncbi:phage portal protein [Sphingomonas nostoxanthinifaciens]|uniref:phage portal protein n=1 Tax=Sphingomonas nostoxanthinifaciens TaxID=2872652 RepID=UPI001CC20A7F|nr:phage portal protein [Sphingomonas nostoxanthinifaciens]UAK24192.1 phage portal protein [Sphingomonas nostoxanthinifaciens]UAK24355.1 phage portal protein [Sphingomonas nostoxanthinifaciens]